MPLDPDRLEAGLAAGLATVGIGAIALVATLFAEPPPTRRQVLRAVAEPLVGVFLAVQAGYALGEPVAAFTNGVAQKFAGTSPGLDALAGGLIVGVLVLRGVTVALDLLEKYARRKAELAKQLAALGGGA